MGLVSTLGELRETAHAWGVDPDERERHLPCDDLLPDAPIECWRGVDVEAPPALVYRWVCQLRIAPYSYDWLDNFGRQSPPELVRGLAALEVGQQFMGVFRLVDFEPGATITLRTDRARWVFGDVAVTYLAEADGATTRLLAKLRIEPPRLPHGWFLRWLYEPGDFVMMRKQLLTLKSLAEATASSYPAAGWDEDTGARGSLLPPPDWGRRDGPHGRVRSRGRAG